MANNAGYPQADGGIIGIRWFDKQKTHTPVTDDYKFDSGNDVFNSSDSSVVGSITEGSIFDAINFYWPNYNIQSFINDKFKWQRAQASIDPDSDKPAYQPGWYFFKIFFETYTNVGLFGGIVKDKNNKYNKPQNCALSYLYNIRKGYKAANIESRIIALHKFANMFNNMCDEMPWIFKGVNGLDQISSANITDITKDKEIELVFNIESLDNKIATIFDLYKYACYDNVNCKEIIPVNLRKFNMSIIVYHIPTMDHLTAGKKMTMNYLETLSNMSNLMSFKMYSFYNCEFIPESLNTLNPASMVNETPFQIDGITIKIKYDRVYEQRMNEWEKFIFGSTGFIYDEAKLALERVQGNITDPTNLPQVNINGNDNTSTLNDLIQNETI